MCGVLGNNSADIGCDFYRVAFVCDTAGPLVTDFRWQITKDDDRQTSSHSERAIASFIN